MRISLRKKKKILWWSPSRTVSSPGAHKCVRRSGHRVDERRCIPAPPLGAGRGYVAASWGNQTVVAVYLPPSMGIPTVTRSLDEIGALVRGLRPARAIVAGDFIAKARAWGFPVANPRGHHVLGWAAETGLVICNDI